MSDVFVKIVTDIMKTCYQAFWFSFLFAVVVMFLYMYAGENGDGLIGLKVVFNRWWKYFKSQRQFRCMFLLAFYITMVLFRTLINRNLWLNPLSAVNGGWSIYTANGSISIAPIENFLMLMPYSILFLMSFKNKLFKEKELCFKQIVFRSFQISFGFSLWIELAQLIFRVGTFQFSDLFYNTCGGILSAVVYWIALRCVLRER